MRIDLPGDILKSKIGDGGDFTFSRFYLTDGDPIHHYNAKTRPNHHTSYHNKFVYSTIAFQILKMGEVVKKISHPQSRTRSERPGKNSPLLKFFALLTFCAVAAFAGLFIFIIPPKSSNDNEQVLRGSDAKNPITDNNVAVKYNNSKSVQETVTLMTSQGGIVISLRPDLAFDSVNYIRALLDSSEPCTNCRFYRAEQRGILQGILKKNGVRPNRVLGKCPLSPEEKHELKEEDRLKPCHGPHMTRGMVGWAAGGGGPDFFIDYYPKPAMWWGREHTVWGEIVDQSSLDIVEGIFDLPAHKKGLVYLDDPLPIKLQ